MPKGKPYGATLHCARSAKGVACKAYIASQKHEGWILVEKEYSDGGTLNRPAIQELLQDIKDGLVNMIVVYKIDRLTRSLHDFSKLVNIFDAHHASFVSITQQFNTSTSMGRLTLNIKTGCFVYLLYHGWYTKG